jgi:hypothetical protein
MRLLTPSEEAEVVDVYGTVKGISQTDQAIVARRIQQALPKDSPMGWVGRINLRDLSCSDLLHEFRLGLKE